MGAPVGNQNAAKRNRMLTDALRRQLTQNPEQVAEIVRTLVEKAIAGESWAQQLAWERLDGKVAQALIGGDDDDPAIKLEAIGVTLVRPQ